MRVYLFTYNRPQMLKQTLRHLALYGIDPIVFHDGVTHPFRGKQGYWETWNEALIDAFKNPSDLYLFMPDDFQDIDIEKIKQLHEKFKKSPYVYNIINDGRHESWLPFKKQRPVNGTEQVGFCDCGFFCNRSALEATRWRIKPVEKTLFIQNPNISSGVGRYLTFSFKSQRVPMYKPVKSLAYHGDHESQMHPQERIKTPLKSK